MYIRLRIGLIVIIFLGIIVFPLLNKNFKLIKDLPNTENRNLARKPRLNVNKLDAFPAKYDLYYNDRFTIRSIMLRYFNLYNVAVLHKSPLPDKLVIGKNNWLFMNAEYLPAYTGKNQLTIGELHSLTKEFEYRQQYLKQRNCKLYIMIMPDKATIYSNQLPSSVYKLTPLSYGETFIDYLRKHSSVNTVDVFTEFKQNANKVPLYYKTDTHVNDWGGLYAVNTFLTQAQKDFAMLSPFSTTNFIENKTPKTTGNISMLMGNIKNFNDYVYQLTPKNGFAAKTVNNIGYPCITGFPYCNDYEHRKQIANSTNPKLLIIADSFGNFVFPYLSEKFSTTEMIFDAWQYKLNEDIVNREKPDAMLYVILEGNLRNILNHQSWVQAK